MLLLKWFRIVGSKGMGFVLEGGLPGWWNFAKQVLAKESDKRKTSGTRALNMLM